MHVLYYCLVGGIFACIVFTRGTLDLEDVSLSTKDLSRSKLN